MTGTSTMQSLDVAAIERYLVTRRIGRRLHCYAELDSTNTTARELAEAGAEEGTVVIAESQRRGRGRLGRQWVSPPSRNLYLSMVLRPQLAPAAAPQITLMAGLATAETVREWTADVAIKWPNDVVSRGRKLAGILTEMVAGKESGGRVRFVIPGIGVNLNSEPDDFPPELRDIAISLRSVVGVPIDRARFTAELLNCFEARYEMFMSEGFRAIAPLWGAYSCLTGEYIVVHGQGAGGTEQFEGTVLGLAADGTLRLQQRDGSERCIMAGDVTVVSRAGSYMTTGSP